MQAFETHGHVDENGKLNLVSDLPLQEREVKVIILYNDKQEPGETAWLSAISGNPAFDFLKDSAEDLYSLRKRAVISSAR